MTCQECIHYEVCAEQDAILGEKTIDEIVGVENHCEYFNQKSSSVKVKHGEWIEREIERQEWEKGCFIFHRHTVYTCSVCNTSIVGLKNMFYCPYCGAKMDGEKALKERENN